MLHITNGDFAAAVQVLEEAVDRIRGFGLSRPAVLFLGMLSDACRSAGSLDRAREAADEALRLVGEVPKRYAVAWA